MLFDSGFIIYFFVVLVISEDEAAQLLNRNIQVVEFTGSVDESVVSICERILVFIFLLIGGFIVLVFTLPTIFNCWCILAKLITLILQ